MHWNSFVRFCQRIGYISLNKLPPELSKKLLYTRISSITGVQTVSTRHLLSQPRNVWINQSHICAGYHLLASGVRSYNTRRQQSVQDDDGGGGAGAGAGAGGEEDCWATEPDKHLAAKLQRAVEMAASAIKQEFSMSDDEVMLLLSTVNLASVDHEDLLKTLQLLKKYDISSQQLQRNTWILTQSAAYSITGKLQQKFLKLKEPHLFEKISDGLGLCYFSMEQISNYHRTFIQEAARFPDHPNRLYYVAELLKIPVSLLVEKFIKCHKVLFFKIEHLEKMISILHKYKVPPEDVVRDLWVLGYSTDKAEARLHYASSIGCVPLKPWMCRSSDKIFYYHCQRHQCSQKLLGMHKNITSYLSERLECGETEIKERFLSNRILMKVHILKFERIIDLLLEEGLTKEDIRSCMRVFQYSEERIQGRIRDLKAVGCFPFPMKYLNFPTKKFSVLIKELKSSHHGAAAT